jgi:hypothetical protein
MARTPAPSKTVAALTHGEATRKNIPTAEYQSVVDEQTRTPLQVAYERRNKDLDPQLVWRGKDLQDWSDLIVHAPPLYIQEKIHPKVLIDDLRRQSQAGAAAQPGATPRRAAPRRASGTPQSRSPRAVDNVLRPARQRAEREGSAPHRQRATARGASGGAGDECGGGAAIRDQLRPSTSP